MYPIKAILASVALLLLGNGLLNTLLSLTANDLNYSTTTIGLIMSGYFVGFTGGTFVSGRLIQRMGHIRTFAFCAALCSSMALLHFIWIDPILWLALRFFYGMAFVTLFTVIESWLNTRAEPEQRGKVFGIYMVVNLGAIAAAQQLLRIGTEEAYLLFAISSILICWALLPITITRRPQPEIPKQPRSSFKKLLGFAPLAVIASAMSGLSMGAFWSLLPLYASQLGFSFADVGLLMSITIIGGAVLQLPIGRLSDNFDRRKVLLSIAFVAGILCLFITIAPGRIMLMGLFFLWGGMAFSIYPIAVAQLIDQLHPDEVTAGSTSMLVLHGAGAAFAPLLAGTLMNLIGIQGLPLYMAMVLFALGSYAIYQIRRVSTLVVGEHAHFEPMVQTSHEVLHMMESDSDKSEPEEKQ